MRLPIPLILFAFLALMTACTSEQATPDGLVEPTVEGETVSEQPTLGTRQAMPSGMQGPQVGDEIADACGQFPNYFEDLDMGPAPRGAWDRERYIRWSPDGSQILFNGFAVSLFGHYWTASDLYSVASNGTRLAKIVDVGDEAPDQEWYYWDYSRRDPINEDEGTVVYVQQIENPPDRDPVWGDGGMMMYFDVSPDSSRIVYSTCAYAEDPEAELGELGDYGELVVSDTENPEDTERAATSRGWSYNYEIVLSDIDGGNPKRLTTNTGFDNFPLWSPDGSRIAFMTQNSEGNILTIYDVATDSLHESMLPTGLSFVRNQMSWSPDGNWIAFVGASRGSTADYPVTPSVYITSFSHFDDSRSVLGFGGPGIPFRTRTTSLSHTASAPAWSPDGQRIAMVVPRPGGGSLYTFTLSGLEPVFITHDLPVPWGSEREPWMGNLAWSPDGSEILFKSFTYRVPLDGSPPIGSPLTFKDWDGNSQVEIPMDAAWSPDGAQLAVRIDDFWSGTQESGLSLDEYPSLVFLMDRDNSNVRHLVKTEEAVDWYSPTIELRLAE